MQAKTFELCPSVGHHPYQKTESLCPLIIDHILEKKVSLIGFRQILSNFLPEACIFSNTILTYLKKLVGTKSVNSKQCPAGLSRRIIPHYPPKHLWKTLGMKKNPTNSPKFTYFPHQKNPL